MARTPPVRIAAPTVRIEPQRRGRRPASIEVLHPARNAPSPRQDSGLRLLAHLASLILHPLQHRLARVTVEPRWRSHGFAAGSTAAQMAEALPAEHGDGNAEAEHAAIDRYWAIATMIAAASLVVAVSVIVAPRLRDESQPIDPESSAMLQQGTAVYASSCAGCHGANLKGSADAQGFGPPPLDASGHAWLHSDTSLFRMVKFGITDCLPGVARVQMPSFSGQLDDRSIHAALAFIKSRWPADVRSVQNAFNDGESDTAETQEAVLCAAICEPPSPSATGR
jgi:S-disulfanyl-L-cysteine oxidoreductase SoxD